MRLELARRNKDNICGVDCSLFGMFLGRFVGVLTVNIFQQLVEGVWPLGVHFRRLELDQTFSKCGGFCLGSLEVILHNFMST